MPLTATNGMIAGMYSAWLAFRSSAGYPLGNCATPDVPAHNTVYGAYRWKYPVSFAPSNSTLQRALRFGGQRPRGSRYLGFSDFGTFNLTMDGFDEQLDGYLRAYTPDAAFNTGMLISAANALLAVPPRFILGLSIGFTDTDNGVDYFDTYIWNNVSVTKNLGEGASENANTNPNPVQYTVTPDTAQRTGFGALYSATALNVIENTDLFVRIRATKELYLSTYIGDGSSTTFNLPFKPTSSDATGAAGNILLKNGAVTAATSVSTSTKAVVLAAAGADFDIYNQLYPTQYQ